MSDLFQRIVENAVFFAEFMGIIFVIVLVAYLAEKSIKRKNGDEERVLSVRKMSGIAMLGAISGLLMIFLELPVPFAPFFYKIDFSELPALIGTFAYGPVAGVFIEFIKIVLKLFFKSSSTAFVGELANFAVGCTLILPASLIYQWRKNKNTAFIGCAAGTICMTLFGTAFNAVYLLPKFSELYGMPLDALIAFGTEINPAITDITSFVILAVAPLNLVKGGLVSILTLAVYKPLSPVLKSIAQPRDARGRVRVVQK
jgi:riboflavin transporter FmnP